MKINPKIKQAYNDVFMPISPFVFFTVIQIISHEFGTGNKGIIKFPEYDSLFQPFMIAIQIAIGLTGIVLIFYLGKIHDYKREFFKDEIELAFSSEEVDRLVKSTFGEEVNTQYLKLVKAKSQILENARHMFSTQSLFMIKLAYGIIIFFGYSLFVLVYFKEIQSLIGFSSSVITFGIGIYFFIREWRIFEKIMSNSDVILRLTFAYLTLFKQIRENKDSLKDNLENYLSPLSTVVESLKSTYDYWGEPKPEEKKSV